MAQKGHIQRAIFIKTTIIGQKPELAKLNLPLAAAKSELVAVIGRRRVGKTFLVKSAYREHFVFDFFTKTFF